MSTTKSVQAVTRDVIVIARAFGDKPVRLHALCEDQGYIEVSGSDVGKTINFPATNIYRFDDALYESLRTAYANNDRAVLQNLWRRAIPFSS